MFVRFRDNSLGWVASTRGVSLPKQKYILEYAKKERTLIFGVMIGSNLGPNVSIIISKVVSTTPSYVGCVTLTVGVRIKPSQLIMVHS